METVGGVTYFLARKKGGVHKILDSLVQLIVLYMPSYILFELH